MAKLEYRTVSQFHWKVMNKSKHALTDLARGLTAVEKQLEDAVFNLGVSAELANILLQENAIVSQNDELEAFRALAAEVKYYATKWPKHAGEHMKRLAALCPEGREWTPDMTP